MPTTNLELPLISGNMSVDVVRDMNALAQEIDLKVASKAALQDESEALVTHEADYVKHPGTGSTVGTNNAYTLTLNPAPTSYKDLMGVKIKVHADSTAAVTLNVNGLGAKSLKNSFGNDVINLKANGVYTFLYNSTTGNFIQQGEGGLDPTEKQTLVDAINAAELGSNNLLNATKVDIADSIGLPTLSTDSYGKMASDIDSVKLKIVSRVGGAVTESLDSLANKVVATKRTASGSGVSETTTLNVLDLGSTAFAARGVLPFLPQSLVVVTHGNNNPRMATFVRNLDVNNNIANTQEITCINGQGTIGGARQDANFYVNATSFSLPLQVQSAPFVWYAQE
jgi:hypothetical protein